MKFLCKLLEDDDDAETFRNLVIEKKTNKF